MINWIKLKLGIGTIKNRKVTKARFLYLYIIFGSIGGFGYYIASLFLGLPWHWALSPIYLLLGYMVFRMIKKNWNIIWMYISDVEQGKLLLYLNDYTHFSEDHKLKLIKWVYLDRGYIRLETHLKLTNKILEGVDLSKEEKRLVRCKPVICPQQLKDGVNEAILVNALIWAHNNIQVLDPDLRDIMNLTLDNMLKFNLDAEIEKCKDQKYRKLMETGEKVSKRLKEKK